MHGRSDLGQEVLDDHLLYVTVLEVRVRDRDERLDPLGARLADSDQDAGSERHPGASGRVQCGEAPRRRLVGRAEVRAAALVQTIGERLDHHPLRRADGTQARELDLGERARVGVGEQSGLVEHELRHRREVVDGALEAVIAEPVGRLGITVLGGFAQCEQRFVAAERGPPRGQLEDPIGAEIRRIEAGRRLRERAIAAPVAAQHREGHENLR